MKAVILFWLLLSLFLVAVPASALHDVPVCQGALDGYLGILEDRETRALYQVLLKTNRNSVEDIVCFIPSDMKLSITFPPYTNPKRELNRGPTHLPL